MNKALCIGVPILIAAALGGTFAAARMSLIDIPTITPAPAPIKPSKDHPISLLIDVLASVASKLPKPPPVATQTASPAALPKPYPRPGDVKLASLWNDMDPASLMKIIGNFKDGQVAKVMVLMDEDQVDKVLSMMDPKRASSVLIKMRSLTSEHPNHLNASGA